MKFILRLIKKRLGLFLTAVFFLLLETTAELMQPTYMSYIVDNGVKTKDTGAILHYGLIMVGIALVGALGAVMRNLFASYTSQLISKDLRSELYRKVQTLSFENIDRLQPASIITRITNDVNQIQNFVNGCMRVMLRAPLMGLGSVVLILVRTPKHAPLMLAVLGIAAVLIGANVKFGYPRFGKLQKQLDRLNNVSREFLSAIRVVKAFHAEEEEEQKFADVSEDYAQAGIGAMRISAIFSPLLNLTVNLGIVLLLWRSQAENAGEIGRLMATVNYMTQVLFALGMISVILNSAVRAITSSRRVQEILDEVPVQPLPENPQAAKFQGAVSFEHVSFRYAGTQRDAVSDLNFSVRPGETVGIIGPTGSGKTTLVNLVPRFYDATAGVIRIDGADLMRLDPERLREVIAVVPQKPVLFSGTIAENLRWGDDTAGEEQIRHAAALACADEFIDTFPKGYETQLGQGGVNLSGGQKQRLSLARALVRRPKILILDDCTSALDAATEAKVLKALREEAADITMLLISQRISTVMRADRILCLEDGRMQGFGTHAELLAGCRAYQAIYESQIGGDSDGR
ncbi:MAG: ABC transporter ATP-binding protein [Eubacteriales bacterium]|nr:ABC transporter ATP-binding protein [Eubacteriales bacterium]